MANGLEGVLKEVLTKGYATMTSEEAKVLVVYARKQGIQLRKVEQQVYTSVHLA